MTTVIASTRHPPAPVALFRKALPQERAEAEIRGWNAVAGHLTVPRLVASGQLGDGEGFVDYEHVFADGRCELLLGDVVNAADYGLLPVTRVADLIDDVCRQLCMAAERTSRPGRLEERVPALYADRLREGGRIDRWYLHAPGPAMPTAAGGPTDLLEFSGWKVCVNGRTHVFDLPGVITAARRGLFPESLWLTALTQGDPTEPNIAEPLCWLDFEHAGRNVLAGEVANLLWYLLGMGGWLVPRYQPATYTQTLRLALPPVTVPAIDSLDVSVHRQRAELTYAWRTGLGRQAAIKRLLTWLDRDLGAALGCVPARIPALLRPFLILRILGVIPGTSLNREDALLMLAKVAEASDPEIVLGDFASTTAHDAEGTTTAVPWNADEGWLLHRPWTREER